MPTQQEVWLQQVRDTNNNTLDTLLNNVNSNVTTNYTVTIASYNTANLANTTAKNAYGIANLAYDQANTATFIAETGIADGTQALINASLAYNQANTAYGGANTAYAYANLAYTQTNLGISYAVSAYNQANNAYQEANVAYAAATAASGVAPSTYGSGTVIPRFTVNLQGKITGAANTSIPNVSPSTPGFAPAGNGSTVNFLNAAGGYSAPTNTGVSAQSLSGNGYVKFANGLIMMWGYVNIAGSGPTAVDFASVVGIAFASACFSVQATLVSTINPPTSDGLGTVFTEYVSKTGFTIDQTNPTPNTFAYWFAVGV